MQKQTRRRYTRQFKEEAVSLITRQGYRTSEAARNLDIDARMLGRWKRELEAEEQGARLGPDEREELARLRRDNKRLKMEREILKKAAAFFAKESE